MADDIKLYNLGMKLAGELLGGLNTVDSITHMGYTNGTTVPNAAHTTLDDAESGPRIVLQSAAYTHPVLSLVFWMGASQGNENSGSIAKVGFFTASSSGTLFLVDKLNAALSKNSGKELQFTLNLTVAQG
jgi:hypothetical protein